MSEIRGFRAGSMVLSVDFVEDEQLQNLLKGKEFEGYTGYLFSQSEEERIKRQYRLNMFYESNTAWIQVKEYSASMMEDAIKHMIAINIHAQYIDRKLGWDVVDDRELFIARLTFAF